MTLRSRMPSPAPHLLVNQDYGEEDDPDERAQELDLVVKHHAQPDARHRSPAKTRRGVDAQRSRGRHGRCRLYADYRCVAIMGGGWHCGYGLLRFFMTTVI